MSSTPSRHLPQASLPGTAPVRLPRPVSFNDTDMVCSSSSQPDIPASPVAWHHIAPTRAAVHHQSRCSSPRSPRRGTAPAASRTRPSPAQPGLVSLAPPIAALLCSTALLPDLRPRRQFSLLFCFGPQQQPTLAIPFCRSPACCSTKCRHPFADRHPHATSMKAVLEASFFPIKEGAKLQKRGHQQHTRSTTSKHIQSHQESRARSRSLSSSR